MSDATLCVDRIYLAACARDARLTRICLASIRYFYPDAPIQILAGDRLQPGLAEELKKHWNIEVTELPPGDYGWGLVKLEPLFGPPGQRFLVMDVDTAFTGKVLDVRAKSDAPFFVDDEALSDADFKRLYYDWEKLEAIDPDVQCARKAFNVGQWFGTAGLVKREEFDRWVEWTLPRKLRYPDLFMGGDQGVMNYVVLKKEAFDGLEIDRHTIMRWPGNGMEGLDAASVAAGTAPPLVIHWAGMKATLLRDMVGGDLLQFFEDWYYERMPMGRVRKLAALWRHVWIQWSFAIGRRIKLRVVSWSKTRSSSAPRTTVEEAIQS
ncbi:MAG TPA: hypothetical protein VN694_16325 [Caulobacteraceae bacterium]|nr:hypothetical protein [Caulobacteraceae bacterium]